MINTFFLSFVFIRFDGVLVWITLVIISELKHQIEIFLDLTEIPLVYRKPGLDYIDYWIIKLKTQRKIRLRKLFWYEHFPSKIELQNEEFFYDFIFLKMRHDNLWVV